jgi:hydroxymethylpyrimidine pyrophosphatase-like HAD family hydrolase
MKAVVIDLDGTLAFKHPGRTFYDASTCYRDVVNEKILPYNREDISNRYKIIFLTGRFQKDRSPTVKFLDMVEQEYNINFADYLLYMRTDKDHRKSPVFKKEMLEQFIINHYDVVKCYEDDDRNITMMKNLKLNVMKVDEDGNIEHG